MATGGVPILGSASGQVQGLPDGMTPHQQMQIAKAQVEGVTDMFNRMADLCFRQCIRGYKEPELNVGEVRAGWACVCVCSRGRCARVRPTLFWFCVFYV